ETLSFFAPVAGNHARTEARNGTTQLGTSELVSYRYQALEPPTFLGLTTDRWAFVAIGASAAGVLVVWWLRRRRKPATRDEPAARLRPGMAVQDHEVPIRHKDRAFQDAVPPDLFREFLEQR